MVRPGMVNTQHVTGLSFLLVVYAQYLAHSDRVVACDKFVATPSRLIYVAKTQVCKRAGLQYKSLFIYSLMIISIA